ncbi:MAG TPA: N-acetyl-gamma-glutamyl-phosphate reductase [Acidimicrobiia bacterium]|nr:N-acetyl-gamma-glutamyl-phosphate reductase [Acidimicrobiia bacterium]
MTIRTAIFGASGYAGGELVRILDSHDGFDLVHLGAHSHAGGVLREVHPQLDRGERPLGPNELVTEIDFAFLALPHGSSASLGHQLRQQEIKVVDLGSDYRLDSPARYGEAYPGPHPFPNELADWRYGLPELFDVKGATAVASPGCYPTAVLLAVGPLLAQGLIEPRGIVADCLSGVSGAGRALSEEFLFGEVADGVRAYAVGKHRHRPEIEMGLEHLSGQRATVTFTPHLVPMPRGLLATVTAPLTGVGDPGEALHQAYRESPFVEVINRPPQTRWTLGSNKALVAAVVDRRQNSVIAQCALDNLLKGAAGQAVQAANLMVGYDEAEGLSRSGWMP